MLSAPERMGPVHFSITRWAAWAPGLESPDAWLQWAKAETPPVPEGPEAPPLLEVAAMTRRRIERQGRLALQVAAWCQGEAREMPALFASRHGDPARSFELLSTLARGEALSPTAFALSVHNAIGGQYSMVRKDTANFVSLAAGLATTETAFVEAAGLLGEGHPEVLVVLYDASLPAAYVPGADEPQADFAWAMQVRAALPGEPGLSLAFAAPGPHAAPGPASLPHALQVLHFFLGARPSLCLEAPHGTWLWTRRG